MKATLEILKFATEDVVTASTVLCAAGGNAIVDECTMWDD